MPNVPNYNKSILFLISDANSTLNDKEIVSAGLLNIEISKQRDIEHKHENDSDSSEILPGSNLPMCLTSIEKSSNSSTDPICTQKLITDTSNTVEVNEVSRMIFIN